MDTWLNTPATRMKVLTYSRGKHALPIKGNCLLEPSKNSVRKSSMGKLPDPAGPWPSSKKSTYTSRFRSHSSISPRSTASTPPRSDAASAWGRPVVPARANTEPLTSPWQGQGICPALPHLLTKKYRRETHTRLCTTDGVRPGHRERNSANRGGKEGRERWRQPLH